MGFGYKSKSLFRQFSEACVNARAPDFFKEGLSVLHVFDNPEHCIFGSSALYVHDFFHYWLSVRRREEKRP